jgi:hypothetical protein
MLLIWARYSVSIRLNKGCKMVNSKYIQKTQSYDQRGLILLKWRTGNYVVPAQLSLWCLTFYLSVSICINSLFCRLVLNVKRSLKIGRGRIQRLHQKAHYGLIKIGS